MLYGLAICWACVFEKTEHKIGKVLWFCAASFQFFPLWVVFIRVWLFVAINVAVTNSSSHTKFKKRGDSPLFFYYYKVFAWGECCIFLLLWRPGTIVSYSTSQKFVNTYPMPFLLYGYMVAGIDWSEQLYLDFCCWLIARLLSWLCCCHREQGLTYCWGIKMVRFLKQDLR